MTLFPGMSMLLLDDSLDIESSLGSLIVPLAEPTLSRGSVMDD